MGPWAGQPLSGSLSSQGSPGMRRWLGQVVAGDSRWGRGGRAQTQCVPSKAPRPLHVRDQWFTEVPWRHSGWRVSHSSGKL